MGATAGLGFEVMENLDYTLNTALAYSSPSQMEPVLGMLFGRGLLTGIARHGLFTSITAFGVGYFVTRPQKPWGQRIAVAAASFATGWLCHFFWNSPWPAPSAALRRAVKKAHGRGARGLYHSLQRAQIHLVMTAGQYGDGRRFEEAAHEVRHARAAFAARAGTPVAAIS
jgi:hypothetical protein